jgi:plastocyanin
VDDPWKRLLICGIATAVLALIDVAASATVKPAVGQIHQVVIENMQFTPASLAVQTGERITWVNKDLVPHTATADGNAFDSKSIAPNASWTWVAGRAGAYAYGCTFHPTMKATITVQ